MFFLDCTPQYFAYFSFIFTLYINFTAGTYYNLLPLRVQRENNLVCHLEGRDCMGNKK